MEADIITSKWKVNKLVYKEKPRTSSVERLHQALMLLKKMGEEEDRRRERQAGRHMNRRRV